MCKLAVMPFVLVLCEQTAYVRSIGIKVALLNTFSIIFDHSAMHFSGVRGWVGVLQTIFRLFIEEIPSIFSYDWFPRNLVLLKQICVFVLVLLDEKEIIFPSINKHNVYIYETNNPSI